MTREHIPLAFMALLLVAVLLGLAVKKLKEWNRR